MDRLVIVFNYLRDKDMFLDHYKDLLAKRLLGADQGIDEIEQYMIGKLKLKCGAQFTAKIEGMVNDLVLGEEANSRFKAHWTENKIAENGVNFSVHALTNGYWPTQQKVELILPPVMMDCVSAFQTYYTRNFERRTLNWVHFLGDAIVRFEPKKGKRYDLKVTSLQATLLMALNCRPGGDSFGLEEIMELLGMEKDVIKRLLHSMSCHKIKVLRKTGDKKKLRDSDEFSVNMDFKEKKKVLQIVAPLFERTGKERVKVDRHHAIDAAAVRIMKTRTRYKYSQLVNEVVQQMIMFSPNSRDIRGRIQDLIDREYMRRDDDDPNVLHYLA